MISFLKYKKYLLIVMFMIFFILRLHDLGKRDYWHDEIMTIKYSIPNYSQNFILTPFSDRHPPLYYLLMRGWGRIAGYSEASFRFVSVFFSILAIIYLWRLGIILIGLEGALCACLFMGFSAFQIWYAQEARMFALALFISVFHTYYFIKALKFGRRLDWVLYGLGLGCGLGISYYTLILLLMQWLLVAFVFKNKFRVYLINLFIVCGLASIFFGPLFVAQIKDFLDFFWLREPRNVGVILRTIEIFFLGYSGDKRLYFALDVMLVVIAAGSFFLKKDIKIKFCAFFYALFPLIFIYLLSILVIPFYLDRNLIIFSFLTYLYAAYLISSFNRKFVKIAACAGICLFQLMSVGHYFNYKLDDAHMYPGVHGKMPVKNVALFLIEKMPENAILGVANQGFRETLRFYLKSSLTDEEYQKIRFNYFYVPGKDRLADRYIPGINLKSDEIKKYRGSELWFVFTSWHRKGNFDPNDYAVKKYMDKNAEIIFRKWIDGVLIVRYVNLKDSKDVVSDMGQQRVLLESTKLKNRIKSPVMIKPYREKQRPWLRRQK
jgi:hypothetical protein